MTLQKLEAIVRKACDICWTLVGLFMIVSAVAIPRAEHTGIFLFLFSRLVIVATGLVCVRMALPKKK